MLLDRHKSIYHLQGKKSIEYLNDRNNEINNLKIILSNNKKPVESVRELKNENSKLSKDLKRNQIKLLQFYSELYLKKIKKLNDTNLIIESVDLDKNFIKSLSFDLIGKTDNTIILLYSKESNKLNLTCNISKTLCEDSEIDASVIIKEICSLAGGAGGGQKNYASGLITYTDNIKKIIIDILKKIISL